MLRDNGLANPSRSVTSYLVTECGGQGAGSYALARCRRRLRRPQRRIARTRRIGNGGLLNGWCQPRRTFAVTSAAKVRTDLAA